MRTLLAAAAIVLAACSSSAPAPAKQKAQIPAPDFEIRQIVGPAELNYPVGNIEVKFRLDIGNRADVPMTLSRAQFTTVNPRGGAYTLDRRAYYFNKIIAPHQVASIEVWAKAVTDGETRRSNEPTTIRGELFFDTPAGGYRHVFIKELGQYPGQND